MVFKHSNDNKKNVNIHVHEKKIGTKIEQTNKTLKIHTLSQEITYKLFKVFISSYSSIGNKSTEVHN